MAQLAGDLGSSAVNGTEPHVEEDLAVVAERMRSTVTPVVGYLELISQEGHALSPQRHLEWIATIERRLEAVRETSDQISRICDVLRRSMDDRPASRPRAPEAPAD
jgi:hypothetical protein